MYVDAYDESDNVSKTFGPFKGIDQDFERLRGDGSTIIYFNADVGYWIDNALGIWPLYSGFKIRMN